LGAEQDGVRAGMTVQSVDRRLIPGARLVSRIKRRQVNKWLSTMRDDHDQTTPDHNLETAIDAPATVARPK
jgi:hypothetical protein